ncbi:MAG: hypothetical protein U5K84_09425 [Alkalibacterium sp.]|nr:hypothetical protein [Alkalibacterium sp.]
MSQYTEEIEEASDELSKTENGRFTRETTIQIEEHRVENGAQGRFVMTDEGMDWYASDVLEAPDTDIRTRAEIISIGDHTYERFGMIDEEGNYIDQNNEAVEDQRMDTSECSRGEARPESFTPAY